MAAEQLEAEFNLHVVIVANSSERYRPHAALLEKNGFPCRLVQATDSTAFENPRPGTIFYLSFNLGSADTMTLVKVIENTLKMTCVVFAEEDDFKTAAKLSSAKFTQTLQFPYTEKNFLMGVQMIVKRRVADHEKELRKQNLMERRMANQLGVSDKLKNKKSIAFKVEGDEQKDPGTMVFSSEANPSEPDQPIIIQQNASSSGGTHVQKGSTSKGFSVTQEGSRSQVVHIKGQPLTNKKPGASSATQPKEKPKAAKSASPVPANAAKPNVVLAPTSRVIQPSPPTAENQRGDNLSPQAQHALQVLSDSHVAVTSEEPAQKKPKAMRESTDVLSALTGEWEPSTRWAVLSVSLLGILVCLYCVYQILNL